MLQNKELDINLITRKGCGLSAAIRETHVNIVKLFLNREDINVNIVVEQNSDIVTGIFVKYGYGCY